MKHETLFALMVLKEADDGCCYSNEANDIYYLYTTKERAQKDMNDYIKKMYNRWVENQRLGIMDGEEEDLSIEDLGDKKILYNEADCHAIEVKIVERKVIE